MTNTFAPATDVHVHLLPERLLRAIQRALNEEAGWQFPHPIERNEIEQALESAGVERYFVLPYAHRPNMADDLNDWVIDQAEDTAIVPFATVHGDDDVGSVVERAFESGAQGLKFQCPVQECSPTDPRLDPAFELAAEYDRPIIFHAGTAPMYKDSPHVGADQFEQFLASYPDVRASCAHMGTFEYELFIDIVREHDNAFLDTSFAMSTAVSEYMEFDPTAITDSVFEELSESIMYGSDYPNIPHSYRAERENLLARDLSDEVYDNLFRETAKRFLGEEQ